MEKNKVRYINNSFLPVVNLKELDYANSECLKNLNITFNINLHLNKK